ncbi:MAG TPA: hypothetical protein VNN62_10755 [Methylomirabilota bacterium]|nr:hypothetical protein [Methylomirabilota bacterium]
MLEAQTHLEQAIILYDPRKRRLGAIHDSDVAGLSIAALNLLLLGYGVGVG